MWFSSDRAPSCFIASHGSGRKTSSIPDSPPLPLLFLGCWGMLWDSWGGLRLIEAPSCFWWLLTEKGVSRGTGTTCSHMSSLFRGLAPEPRSTNQGWRHAPFAFVAPPPAPFIAIRDNMPPPFCFWLSQRTPRARVLSPTSFAYAVISFACTAPRRRVPSRNREAMPYSTLHFQLNWKWWEFLYFIGIFRDSRRILGGFSGDSWDAGEDCSIRSDYIQVWRNVLAVIYRCPRNDMNYGVDLHKGGLICITGHKAVPSLKMTLLPARKYSQTKQQQQRKKKPKERKKEMRLTGRWSALPV